MMYAEVTQLTDRYAVEIFPDDLSLEVLDLKEIDKNLNELGYVVRDRITIDDDVWHIILDDRTVSEKAYRGYGLRIDYYKIYEVCSVLDSGISKDGKHSFPVPGTELAKDSRQIKDCIVYQNKDSYSVWSNNKQSLDILRRKTIEWRRNHRYRIERFI